MYLKSLEVQGFKSFPDKTLIRFGDDITAIVGPNGSGKSNISDAILWVMGEQSTKTLRGAKMEDVIFGGTQKRSPVGFAEATLTLDNTDRALDYDADEVMVTRRYYRSGDSEYYINRQSARLRDIHEMFMDTGLGREGYSNIGQGRIDEILSLKSADRREIFEEAAGISKYRHRKEETERKLGHTEDNLLRINDKVSELELQLEPLRQQSEKAVKYLALKDELQGVEVAVWLDRLDKLSAEAKKAEEDYKSASFVLEQAKQELDALYAATEQMSVDLRSQNGCIENIRIELSMLEGVHQQIEGQITVLRGAMQNNEENIRRSQEDMEGQENRRSGIATQMEQAQSRVDEIAQMLITIAGEVASQEQKMAAMTADAQGITRQFMELRSLQVRLSADLAAKETDLRALQQSIEQSGSREQELKQDLSAGEERRQQVQAGLDDCRSNLRKAREEVTATGNTIAGYALRQTTRAERRDALLQQVNSARTQLESTQAKARVFRAMEKDLEGYQKSVRAVMQEAKRGGLPHVHGPISQLIRTDDSYTVAIEIALGGALQNVVVDTAADGKAAINFLNRSGNGRATFLPIAVIQPKSLNEKGVESCGGFVGIADELVSCDKQYRDILSNLLGRTVIVRDMDSAIAIAKKYNNRFKLVTLGGQVINPGGAMTGGSVHRDAGILSRANELERLTHLEESQTQALQKLDEEYREALRLADQVEFQLTTAREQLAAGEKQVLMLEGEEKQYEILLQAVCDAAASAQREQESLQTRLRSDREAAASVSGQITLLKTQLSQTQLSLEALEGSQAETEQQVSKLTDAIGQLHARQAALEAERATAASHIADLRVLQAAAEGDRDRKLKDMDDIRVENIHLQEQIRSQQQRQQENAQRIDEMRKRKEDALGEYARLDENKSRTDGEIQQKSKSILNTERACALLESKNETTAVEERSTIEKLWDTYGLTPSTAVEKRGQIESVAAGNRRIAELKRKIGALGTPNLGAIEEYARVNERYSYLTGQRDDVMGAKKELETIIRQITEQMTTIFVAEFAKINQYFGQVFEEMFGGGKGQLLLEDPEEPLTCGIEIRVQPPGKQVKTITLLSGGEKAFVAIALYFAILKVRPTPFCMLDEIDAALDDRNVERFSTYLRNLSERTQFIVITHRRGTMEASDVLYGVTMQEQGISKLLRLDLNQMETQLGITE